MLALSTLAFAAGGTLEERVACAADPAHTYALYRPAGFDPGREWPVLLVLDPRGDAVGAAERFFAAADAYGWVVASSWDTRSDVLAGPEPNTPAVLAVLADLDGRVPMDHDAVVLAGFSGTARVAWEVAAAVPEVAYAALSVGAGLVGDAPPGPFPTAVYLAAGRRDFNEQEVLRTDRAAGERGVVHRAEVFDGGHQWAPPELASRMVGWAEVVGQRLGRRPTDAARVDHALAADRAWLGGVEDPWASAGAHEAVARTYAGLREVGAEQARAEALAADPVVRARARLERRLAREEATFRERLGALTAQLGDADRADPRPAEGVAALDALALLEAASRPDPRGDAAARSLALARGWLVNYVPGYARIDDDPLDAVASLAVAAAIWPDDAAVRYDLACAEALAGRTQRALDELERAVALGFADRAWMAADPDLASLREEPRFQALL